MVTHRTAKRLAAGLCVLASAFGFCLTAAPGIAQTPVFPTQPLTVEPAFAAAARNNISGATCADASSRVCLVVNDATNFAQLFSVASTALRTGPIVGITSDPKDTVKVLHAEGAAHDRRFFYVVTSRAKELTGALTGGLPGGQADTSFLIIRLSIDSAGRPPVPGSLPTVEVSERIRDALAAGIAIPQIPGQQLTRAGADIQGIAVKDGVIHLGFRTPVLSGKSFIVSAPVAALFGSGPLNLTVRSVGLAPNLGIHDLAAASDGLMILAGPERNLAGRSALFHFNDSTGQLQAIAGLVEPSDRKADGLLLLREDPEFYQVVVLFNGVPDGSPIEYIVPR